MSDLHEKSVEEIARGIVDSYLADERTHHIDAGPLPSRYAAIGLLEKLRDLFFPGYFTTQRLTEQNIYDHVVALVAEIRETLETQIDQALCYGANLGRADRRECDGSASTAEAARTLTDEFLARIPALRAMIALDVQAAYDGDPAAVNTDETIFCYPGVDAIFTYRVAHALYDLGVPLLPRILSEYVHNETGVDIHPGAKIGESFFIDHATGVVIGETTVIGNRVKIYQGVTLGALSFARDEAGRLIRGTKRHPTIEDDVIIYANATVLGGNTVVGHGSVVGGSVFLTKSVPPNHYVTLKGLELKFRAADVHHRMETQQRQQQQ
jgi:serine O-acetyltransferase